MNHILFNGDCLETLKELPSDSIDSLITDPPAGISFMGKAWDEDKGGRKQWVAWMTEVMAECLRVLKPGAHGLVWAIPRTSHWTATALEDAGFEVRDVITHHFGSGFPKSMNIEKAGAGSQWSGWGTALKPASEHWILVRKPCSEKTVAANVLKHGTGGINVDASRVEGLADIPFGKQTGDGISANGNGATHGRMERTEFQPHTLGRFPANLILSHSDDCLESQCALGCPIRQMDGQSGILKSGARDNSSNKPYSGPTGWTGTNVGAKFEASQGGASRFFYCAKASKKDKGADNSHPTVKSTQLMDYLIKMITPPGGSVLDPFLGSGTTGVSAVKNGHTFIGIEKEAEYFDIASKRIEDADKAA